MADKVKLEDPSMPNVRALSEFRVQGKAVAKGEVVSKADFPNKQDWMNLLHMPKPRIEETKDAVGKAKAPVESKTTLPGA